MASGIARILRASSFVTIAGLVLLTSLAWLWLASGAGMPHGAQFSLAPFDPGGAQTAHATSGAMAMGDWSPRNVALTISMWWIMMVAMMLPAAAPVVLLYDRSYRTSYAAAASPIWSFLAGYLVAWGGFSIAAALAQILLDRASLLSPAIMAFDERILSAIVLIAAGLYQLTPAKQACLRQCRNPAEFIARYHSPGAAGAFRLGLIHGSYCLGCCWLLMVLLFVGGVMNLVWIAVLSVVVAVEKLLPRGKIAGLVFGYGFIGWGGWLLFSAWP